MNVWMCACKIMRQPCCHNPKSKHTVEWADGGIETTRFGLLTLKTKPTTATLHILIPHNLSFLLVSVGMETLESMLWHFWVNYINESLFAHTYGTHFFSFSLLLPHKLYLKSDCLLTPAAKLIYTGASSPLLSICSIIMWYYAYSSD